MAQVIDKRSADSRSFDIDCSFLLLAAETVVSVVGITSDQSSLVFGTPTINGGAITYPDGRIVPAGKVVQVQISGGLIPSGQPFLVCTVRALMQTSLNPAVEATVLLRLVDSPSI
jgi:hypothetical protein